MLISALIHRLEDVKQRRGDLPVYVYDEYDIFPIGVVAHHELLVEADGYTEPECIVIQAKDRPAYSTEEA